MLQEISLDDFRLMDIGQDAGVDEILEIGDKHIVEGLGLHQLSHQSPGIIRHCFFASDLLCIIHLLIFLDDSGDEFFLLMGECRAFE
jgi:hypothetical protein